MNAGLYFSIMNLCLKYFHVSQIRLFSMLLFTPHPAKEQLLGCQRSFRVKTQRQPLPEPGRLRPWLWQMPARRRKKRISFGKKLTNTYLKKSRERWDLFWLCFWVVFKNTRNTILSCFFVIPNLTFCICCKVTTTSEKLYFFLNHLMGTKKRYNNRLIL